MKVVFNTSTCIKDVEEHIRTLVPHEVERPYSSSSLPAKPSLRLQHWPEDDEDNTFGQYAFAQQKGEGWVIETPTSNSTWRFTQKDKGMVVTYEGPFMGMGDSPYIPELDYFKLPKGKVVATGFVGTLKDYLQHRLDTLAYFNPVENAIYNAGLPTALESLEYFLFVFQREEPVIGFESTWPGTPVEVRFSKTPPVAARVAKLKGYHWIPVGKPQYHEGPVVPIWIVEGFKNFQPA